MNPGPHPRGRRLSFRCPHYFHTQTAVSDVLICRVILSSPSRARTPSPDLLEEGRLEKTRPDASPRATVQHQQPSLSLASGPSRRNPSSRRVAYILLAPHTQRRQRRRKREDRAGGRARREATERTDQPGTVPTPSRRRCSSLPRWPPRRCGPCSTTPSAGAPARRGPQGNRTPLLPTFSNQGWPQSSRFLGGWIRQFMAPVGSFYLIIIRPDGPRWCSLSLVTSYFLLLVLNGLVTLWLMIGYTRTGKLI